MHDFQAVVFAGGRGSRMTDLTTTIPKCLLPVANIPMIVYPLTMLQNADFTNAIVLVPSKCSTDVKKILLQYEINIKLDFLEIPSDDEDMGTAEALLLVLPRITKDVLLISCDFVCDFPLLKFIDWHIINESHVSLLLSRMSIQGNAPGPKTKKKTERDIIGVEPQTNRLAFMCGETDLEDDFINLSKNLLVKFPRVDFTTKLFDCHAYIVNRRLLDLLKVLPGEFISIKTDLLPFLIKLQHYKWSSVAKIAVILQDLLGPKVDDCFKLKCASYILANEDFSVCARLNNTGAYFETNKQVIKALSKIFPNPSMTPLIQSHPPILGVQIGLDSLFGQGSSAGKKSQIKRSIIGRQCTIGENCKLNNTVVMDHVHIANGTTLVNCIICHSSEIPEKCDLKDCLLGTNQRVSAGAKLSVEVIGGETHKMMEI